MTKILPYKCGIATYAATLSMVAGTKLTTSFHHDVTIVPPLLLFNNLAFMEVN